MGGRPAGRQRYNGAGKMPALHKGHALWEFLGPMTMPQARVGTVDKLQGQQAEVVLVSMVTSSGDDLPRDFEFLYSKNRLKVAISRARILACIIASPRLLQVECSRVEQLKLVNTVCWAKQFAGASN
jgi:uncharacterized protein